MLLKNKKILLGVCGSIAAYKTPELVRLFRQAEADVSVMLTDNAAHFVAPLTLQTLSGRQVLRNMFEEGEGIVHIEAVRNADVLIIAPATANMLAKLAFGLADDLVSTAVLACDKPVLIVPAMNVKMWTNRLVKRNVKILKEAGYHFLDPEEGDLACGERGTGRMAGLKKIMWEAARLTTAPDLRGKKVLITAGPTREYGDPVRFISNASSGKMGFALSKEAYFRGAEVTVVAGTTAGEVPDKVKVVRVISADDMMKKVTEEIKSSDVFIANAAVCDYRFAAFSNNKIKKSPVGMSIRMLVNPDILAHAGRMKKRPFIVGFALETDEPLKNALAKMKRKNVDLMVANGVDAMETDSAAVILITKGKVEKLAKMPKESIARSIFNKIVKFI